MKHRLLGLIATSVLAMPLADAQQSNPAPQSPTVSILTADSALEARTSAVASTLRCPVCQGESIQDSPSSLAQQMRAVIRDRLRAGQSPQQVKAYFVSRYGEWILLEPRPTGLNIALYVLPVVLVLGGLILIVVLVRRWTRPLVTAGGGEMESTDSTEERAR